MSIQIRGKEEDVKNHKALILKAGERTLSLTNTRKKNLSVMLTDNSHIRAMNKEFRGVDSETDVLSFPYGEKGSLYLGDIAISLPMIRDNAKTYNQSFEDELARVVIHGILHLLGERDDKSQAKKKMWDKQEKILKTMTNEKSHLPVPTKCREQAGITNKSLNPKNRKD